MGDINFKAPEGVNADAYPMFLEGARKYKSTGRAVRRGHMTSTGLIVPHRPFNHRGNSCKRKGHHSRNMNETKKRIYGELTGIDD